MSKILTIITEGGLEFGFGHLTRTLSLAQSFVNHKYKIKFIVDGDKSIYKILDSYDVKNYNWKCDSEILISQIKDSTLILIDSLIISDSLVKELESLKIPIILFDDEKRKNILEQGFVIDWTVLGDMKEYFIPRKENVTYFLGAKYTALRKDFLESKRACIQRNINSIMISFGGSDVKNLTPKILNFLNKQYPLLKKDVVIGVGFQNIDEIKKVASEDTLGHTNLLYNLNTSSMVECMLNNDLAISAGGQTLYELARIGTPTIAVLLVDNAKDDTLGWNEVGFVDYIGWYDDKNLLDNLLKSIKKIEPYLVRKKMFESVTGYLNLNQDNLLVEEIIRKVQ